MDNNMLKFIKIRNSYTIPKIGELSINEKALLEYEKFCLELMNQAEKQKKVIDKVIEKINDYKIYCEKNKGFTEYTDIEIEAIEPVISKLEDILNEGKNE